MRIDGHSVFGYFTDREDAEAAEERLAYAGFHDIQVDSVSLVPGGERTPRPTNPSVGDFGSLSRLTMGVDAGDDTGILLAADNTASGYGAGGAAPREYGWMIVAVTDGSDVQVERAVKILKSHGADV